MLITTCAWDRLQDDDKAKANSEDNLKKTHAQDRPEDNDVTKANCKDDLKNTRGRDIPKDNDEMNRYERGNQSYTKKYGWL